MDVRIVAESTIFSIYDFFAEGKKSKYRWFKVVGFGGGGLVIGSKKSVTCPVSQRVSCVKLRKAGVAV